MNIVRVKKHAIHHSTFNINIYYYYLISVKLCFFSFFQNVIWSPSKMIARFGQEIDNPDSVYYWAYKVHIL